MDAGTIEWYDAKENVEKFVRMAPAFKEETLCQSMRDGLLTRFQTEVEREYVTMGADLARAQNSLLRVDSNATPLMHLFQWSR